MARHHMQMTASLAVATALLAGCASHDNLTTGSIPTDYRQNHPIIIADQEQALDVPVAAGARDLNTATRSNITAFARAFTNSGAGVLHMLVPAGSPNEHAAKRVREEMLGAIEAGGASRHDVSIQAYEAGSHGSAAPVRLSYAGLVAATPKPCGQWPDDLDKTPDNRNFENFGCSVQSNLAAQVANPGDFLGPRAETPIDAIQRGAVIQTYQDGPQPKPSEVTF